ncbi:TRAP transporter small permease [Cobetia marina]|uniref:TRAP transporter small permease n=1 Tax=Cobetia marina TaxID=28258 RepID=UPI0020C78DC2
MTHRHGPSPQDNKQEGLMERLFRYLLTGLISTVAAFQFVQVISRYVFETPLMGLEELAIIPTIWLYILGSVNASREDNQIRANVLDIFLKTSRARAVLQAVSDGISIVVTLWLSSWAWNFFSYSWRVGKETPTLYLPTFIYESALFIGLSLMVVFMSWHFLRNLTSLIGWRKEVDHPLDEPDNPETTDEKECQLLTALKQDKHHD